MPFQNLCFYTACSQTSMECFLKMLKFRQENRYPMAIHHMIHIIILNVQVASRSVISVFIFVMQDKINYNEDFDFEAMNEKFNKEEIWGLLSKKDQKAGTEDEGEGDGREGDEAGEPKAKHKVDQFSISVACCLGYM